MKAIKPLLTTIWNEGPKMVFWVGILWGLVRWLSGIPLWLCLLLVTIPTLSLVAVIRRGISDLRSQLLKIGAEDSLRATKAKEENRVKGLISNIPSLSDIEKLYQYAEEYAKSWASDGVVSDINLYLTSEGNKVKKSAQIFIKSRLRGERLITYLPRMSERIEEIGEPDHFETGYAPKINSYKHWSDAVRIAIEASASDVEKSDVASVQISPLVGSLHINLRLEKGKRGWVKRFELKWNKIINDKSKIVHRFA